MSILERIDSPLDLKDLTVDELKSLSEEIRQQIIATVTKNGGHLASALGVIELTVALHYIFNAPVDKIIFDVGHQSYAHKILTGRKNTFDTLRRLNGVNGFTRASESPYDTFISGHSSTSLSVAAGLMRARNLTGASYEIISVIGDGALSGGMTHEALNDAGNISGKQIIILNDNAMSISKSVGSIADYLARMHTVKWYNRLKGCTKRRLTKPKRVKGKAFKILKSFRNSIKYLLQGGLPFDQYGIKYFGPVDGHNIEQLIRYLKIAKNESSSVVIHVVTVKGKGYQEAVNNPNKYHGLSSPEEICPEKTFSKQAGISLSNLARENNNIVGITAAMCSGTGLEDFQKEFPDRFYDVGIAEGHAITMAAAMASEGFKPYFAVYSTFLQRAFDQIIHDVSIERQDVTLLVDRSGIVGPDGETHQGIFDISYLSLIPKMTIASPADIPELDRFIRWSADFKGPLAIRYPRGGVGNITSNDNIVLGKWSVLKEGDSEIVIIATGADMAANAIKAAKNTDVTVINARFVKPLDNEMLRKIKDCKIITIEDNVLSGGLYSAIASFYLANGIRPTIIPLGIKDTFVPQGTKQQLFRLNNIDSESIVKTIKQFNL